jgi:cyclophilin family peptidyl-prolyl cis-trans isomerase
MTSGRLSGAFLALFISTAALSAPAAVQDTADRPIVVVETSKGTFAFETFPNEAPVTVAHVLALVRAHFYDGQRVHRAQAGFIVQFGDPQTRDPGKREIWGRGAGAGSGKPVGAVETSRKHLHVPGAIGLAHMGDPGKAESQIYVALSRQPSLDGRYVVFGQVISGADVPGALQVGDDIRLVYIR